MNAEISSIITFGILTAIALTIGWQRGFFVLPAKEWQTPIRFYHLIGAFAIYFFSSVISFMVVSLWKKEIMAHYLAFSIWLNFGLSFLIFILLSIYCYFLPRPLTSSILHRPSEPHSFAKDVWVAFYAWVLAFPLTLFLSQSLEFIIFKIFKITQVPDQIAVKFLKSTFENPLYFIFAVIAIVILAPLIEETLFRGFLQSYIRRHLGRNQAILITSICFSLFHYSAGQGLGNISIIISLFVLSLFLGFIYEKQGSIFSSMTLHASFNAVSVINLYLFGGFTTGI